MGACNCSLFCCTLLYVHSSIAIILMGKRESWLLCLVCLSGVSWWLSGSSSRCHRVFCGLWLWYFLIILLYIFAKFTIRSRVLRSLLKYLLLCYCISWFPLNWYATWLCSEKVEFWPIDPIPRVGGVCGQNICYHAITFAIMFNLICNMTIF